LFAGSVDPGPEGYLPLAHSAGHAKAEGIMIAPLDITARDRRLIWASVAVLVLAPIAGFVIGITVWGWPVE
jgi:hypothetical protein